MNILNKIKNIPPMPGTPYAVHRQGWKIKIFT